MTAIERIESGPRYSHAVIHNGVVYVTGVCSPGSTVEEQTRNVLRGIDEVLQRAGTDKSKIVSASVWLTDIGKFEEMNRAWDKWVPPGNAPARVCVEAKLACTAEPKALPRFKSPPRSFIQIGAGTSRDYTDREGLMRVPGVVDIASALDRTCFDKL